MAQGSSIDGLLKLRPTVLLEVDVLWPPVASSPSPNSVSRPSSNCSKSIENKNPANADPHPQAPSQGPTPQGYACC